MVTVPIFKVCRPFRVRKCPFTISQFQGKVYRPPDLLEFPAPLSFPDGIFQTGPVKWEKTPGGRRQAAAGRRDKLCGTVSRSKATGPQG